MHSIPPPYVVRTSVLPHLHHLAPDPIYQEIPLKFFKYDAEYIFELLNSHGQELSVDRHVEIRKQRALAGDEETESEIRAAVRNLEFTYRLGIHE